MQTKPLAVKTLQLQGGGVLPEANHIGDIRIEVVEFSAQPVDGSIQVDGRLHVKVFFFDSWSSPGQVETTLTFSEPIAVDDPPEQLAVRVDDVRQEHRFDANSQVFNHFIEIDVGLYPEEGPEDRASSPDEPDPVHDGSADAAPEPTPTPAPPDPPSADVPADQSRKASTLTWKPFPKSDLT